MAPSINPRLRRMAGEGDAPVSTPKPKAAAKKPATPPAPPEPPPAPAPATRGRLSTGAVLALIGGGVLALIAVIVVVVLVFVAAIRGSGSGGSAGVELVNDITGEPHVTWEHNVAGEADGDLVSSYSAVAVGDDRALVMPVVSSEGASLPDYTPELTMLNLTSGDEVWSIDLNAEIDGTDPGSSFVLTDIPGTAAFLVNAKTTRDDRSLYVLAALNKSDGSVISAIESDVNPVYFPYKGDVVVGAYDPGNDEFTMSRHTVPELDGDSAWEVDSHGARNFYLVGDLVVLLPGGPGQSNEVYSVVDGEEVRWGDDQNAAYVLVAGQLLSYDFANAEVIGINGDDTAAWRDPVGADLIFPLSNVESSAELGSDLGSALLVADASDAGFVNLQRLHPYTGDELWADSWGGEFSRVVGVAGNSVILLGSDKLVVLDLGNGKERFSIPVEFPKGIAFGSSMFYVQNNDEVTAYSYGSGDEVWTYDLRYDPEVIAQVGSSLLVYDRLENTLYGLAD